MLSKQIQDLSFGLKGRELLDDSMLIITNIPTHTNHFYYDSSPCFRVIDKNDFDYNKCYFGVYEDIEKGYIWTEDNLGSNRMFSKDKLELINILN